MEILKYTQYLIIQQPFRKKKKRLITILLSLFIPKSEAQMNIPKIQKFYKVQIDLSFLSLSRSVCARVGAGAGREGLSWINSQV